MPNAEEDGLDNLVAVERFRECLPELFLVERLRSIVEHNTRVTEFRRVLQNDLAARLDARVILRRDEVVNIADRPS